MAVCGAKRILLVSLPGSWNQREVGAEVIENVRLQFRQRGTPVDRMEPGSGV
jgi:hypothetical protein